MKDEPIRIALVAPVHNRREITLQCLRSLERVDKRGLDVHAIIVDDGSDDGTSDAIHANFPNVEVVQGDGNLWFTEGTNVGIRAAKKFDPEYLLLINDDQIFDEHFLQFLVFTARANPRSVVGPLLLLWDEPHKVFQVDPRWETLSGGWRHWYRQTIRTVPDRTWHVEAIVGNCVLVPATAIAENGPMNSKRYPNFGDAEFTPRLRKNGWQLLIDPRSKVFVQPNNAADSIAKMSLSNKIKTVFFDIKKPQSVRRRFYALWDTAPSKMEALLAFIIFFIRYAAGRNMEGRWALQQAEAEIKDLR